MQVEERVTKPEGVHMVGSAPFATPADLFRAVGPALGDRLRRIPDGEPGARSGWIVWQREFIAKSPHVEIVGGDYFGEPEIKLKDGSDPAEVSFGDLGYADAALESYEAFKSAQDAGDIPRHVRFQVSLPTPLDTLAGGIVAFGSRGPLEPAYEAALRSELHRICDAIPHDQLAIQWDLCLATLLWETSFDSFSNSEWWKQSVREQYWGGREGIVERTLRVIDLVPPEVETGFHCCYGDYGEQHDFEPPDLGNVTQLANEILAGASRPIQWVHMPVPISRSDPEYFVPLANLRLLAETKLFLGLLHLADGESGATRRVAAAQSVTAGFGVATECGWGRRSVDEAPELLHLHAAASAPLSS